MGSVSRANIVYEVYTDRRGAYSNQELTNRLSRLDKNLTSKGVGTEEFVGDTGPNYVIELRLPIYIGVTTHEAILRRVVGLLESLGLIDPNNTIYNL